MRTSNLALKTLEALGNEVEVDLITTLVTPIAPLRIRDGVLPFTIDE
jgi:hypothetical protein